MFRFHLMIINRVPFQSFHDLKMRLKNNGLVKEQTAEIVNRLSS